jgi:hypothetical protein
MARDLVDFYYKLVKNGKLDIEEVPAKYREAVRALL